MDAQRTLVILPTYNERENLEAIVGRILAALPGVQLCIVDDNSPDGTGEMADALATTDCRVEVVHRPGKMGLGSAYAESFRRALAQGYQLVVEMDADFSHDPDVLPQLVELGRNADLVLGSRYIPGGSTPDWSLSRRMISRIGNAIARSVLALPIRDCTTGYRVFSRQALAELDLDGANLRGYGFQIETAYQCARKGLTIREYPIVFVDRRRGKSKMSSMIALEALLFVFRRRFRELTSRRVERTAEALPARHDPTNVIG